jgi:LmbE family N-acetylglucosaminyl deacetylase
MNNSTYTPALAAKFCAAIADGGSLRSVCKKAGMPSKATVFRWLGEHPDFVTMYEKATDERADGQIDEIVDIADSCPAEKDAIQKAKLQIHARVEQAQRMKPRKYGRQLQLTGEGGGPVQAAATLDVANLPTEVLTAIMQAKDAAKPS